MYSRLCTLLLLLRKRGKDAVVQSASLVASAYLMAVSATGAAPSWVGWYALLPLFVAIRVCRPRTALLAGAAWGVSLCAGIARFHGVAGISSMPAAWPLLIVLPCAYAYLGARLTRRFGFSPFVLGVGWVFVEMGLTPLGLSRGLLGGLETGTPLLHSVASALGYVHVALLAAWFCGLLVTLLEELRVPDAASQFERACAEFVTSLLSPRDVHCPSHSIDALRPRGPPLSCPI